MTEERASGPVQLVLGLQRRWSISAQEMEKIIGASPEGFLGRPEAEQAVANLFRLYEGLFTLLRDERAENEVIREPCAALCGSKPLDLMVLEGPEGVRKVMEWTEWVNNRC